MSEYLMIPPPVQAPGHDLPTERGQDAGTLCACARCGEWFYIALAEEGLSRGETWVRVEWFDVRKRRRIKAFLRRLQQDALTRDDPQA